MQRLVLQPATGNKLHWSCIVRRLGGTIKGVTRVRKDPETRREELLRLGLRMFGESDYSKVSVARIAKEAGVSLGLLYHYFGDKRGYYIACLRYAHTSHSNALDTLDDVSDPMERLRASVRRYVQAAKDMGHTYRFIISGPGAVDDDVMEIFETGRSNTVKRILEASGAPETPQLIMSIRLWSHMVERGTLDWLDNQRIDEEQLIDIYVKCLLALFSGAN